MNTDAFTRGRIAAALSVTALVALAGCSEATRMAPAPDATRTPAATRPADPDATYEDGTYEARGTYGGGPSFLDVTVTIEDNVITDVAVGTPAENPVSLGYQQRFAAAVPDAVIGKELGEVEVGKLAGASTCPDGFNDAIDQIREEALAS